MLKSISGNGCENNGKEGIYKIFLRDIPKSKIKIEVFKKGYKSPFPIFINY